MTKQIINYYQKYIKYKTKYINLKNNNIENNKKNIQKGGINIQMRIDDNINNKYPELNKEYNIFGYAHSKINNSGCFF